MFKLHRMLLAGVVLAVATSATQAAPVNGQIVLGPLGTITSSGTDLADPTSVITLPTIQATQTGTGDFSGVTVGSVFDANGATIDYSLAASGFGFAFSGPFGSFMADLGMLVTQTSDFLNFYVEGDYMPAGVVTGELGRASLNVTLTFNNGLYGFSAVLNAPPTPIIPEPSSIALAGIGLASAGLFGLRKRYSK